MAGTISRGVRAPIIRQGDDIVSIVVDSVLQAAEAEGFTLHDRDVVAVTEAVVARADGNYCTTDHIAQDVQRKLGDTVGVVFLEKMERVMGLEPTISAWKANVLPLHYTRS